MPHILIHLDHLHIIIITSQNPHICNTYTFTSQEVLKLSFISITRQRTNKHLPISFISHSLSNIPLINLFFVFSFWSVVLFLKHVHRIHYDNFIPSKSLLCVLFTLLYQLIHLRFEFVRHIKYCCIFALSSHTFNFISQLL